MYKFFGKFLPNGTWALNPNGEELTEDEEEPNIEEFTTHKLNDIYINSYDISDKSESLETESETWPIEKPLSQKSCSVLTFQEWGLISSSVLKSIFQYLDKKELQVASQVCFKWQREANSVIENRVSSSLQYDGSQNIDMALICRELRKNGSHLTHLTLIRISDSLAVLRQICRSNPELKEFTLRYSIVDDPSRNKNIPIKNILILLNFCKKLERFDSKGTQFPMYKISRELVNLEYLKAVNLSKSHYLSGADILRIATHCPKLEELKAYNLSTGKHLTDEEGALLLQILRPRIKIFRIDCSEFGRNAFEMISRCKLLEDLGLYNAANLFNDAFLLIGEKLLKLKSFKVDRAIQLKCQDFENFLANLLSKCLERISFPGCHGITANCLLSIADKCGSKLRHLNIRDCQKVTEEALNRTLELCPELYKLNIAFLNINLKCIIFNRKLQYLIVSDPKFISPNPEIIVKVASWPFTSAKIQNYHQPFRFQSM